MNSPESINHSQNSEGQSESDREYNQFGEPMYTEEEAEKLDPNLLRIMVENGILDPEAVEEVAKRLPEPYEESVREVGKEIIEQIVFNEIDLSKKPNST